MESFLFQDNLVALSVVLDVDRRSVKDARKHLAIGINNLESQDLAFVYRADQDKLQKPGFAIGLLADYVPIKNPDYRAAIINSLIVLLREDIDYRKMLFFVFDRFDSRAAYGLKCGLALDGSDRVKIYLCGYGNEYPKEKLSFSNCHYTHFDTFSDIQKFIKERIEEAHGDEF